MRRVALVPLSAPKLVISRTEHTSHSWIGLITPSERGTSSLAIVGRHVLSTAIFNHLRNATPGAGGEIQLTDTIAALLNNHDIYAFEVTGDRYDVGNKLGLAKAWMKFAMDDPEIGVAFSEYAA